MAEKIEMEVLPSGEIRMMYSDKDVPAVAQMLDAKIVDVPRASNVEYESGPENSLGWFAGWTVRAAHDPDLAIRVGPTGDPVVQREGEIYYFVDRGRAIDVEIENFWALLPPASCDIPKKVT